MKIGALVLQFSHFFDLDIFGFELLLKLFNFIFKLIDLLLLLYFLFDLNNIIILLFSDGSQSSNFLLLFITEFLCSASHVMPFLDGKKVLPHAQIVLEVAVIHVLLQGQRFVMFIHIASLFVTDVFRLADVGVGLTLVSVHLLDIVMHYKRILNQITLC